MRALKRGTYFKERRVTYVKVQKVIDASFKIMINNNHYDI